MKEIPADTQSPDDTPWSQSFHEAFQRYNPLYLVSALFVLAGVFLLGLGLERAGRPEARVELTFVIEAYQLLVIAGAALLLRGAGQRRPAMMLAFLEAVFLADPTLQTEILALWEKRVMAGAWLAWGLVKLAALAWALRLRPRGIATAVPVLCLAGIALGPQALDLRLAEPATLSLAAAWLTAAVIGLAARARPAADIALELDDEGEAVLHRCLRAVLQIWTALLAAHFFAWMPIFRTGLEWASLAPFALLVVLLAKKQATGWAAGGLAILASLGVEWTVLPVALLAAVILSWRHRQPLALLLPVPALWPAARRLVAGDPLTAGVVLLVLGFGSLIAGIWYSWRFAKRRASRPEETG